MIHFVLQISRQGKVRLTKWYYPYSQMERSKVLNSMKHWSFNSLVESFSQERQCSAILMNGEDTKLYTEDDNELEILEIVHHYVEILDHYFGSVCELDLIFNFHQAYYILDGILIAGELQGSSKKSVA